MKSLNTVTSFENTLNNRPAANTAPKSSYFESQIYGSKIANRRSVVTRSID
jgi:hypothetical protein